MGSGGTTVHVGECPFCEAALDPSDSGHSLNNHLRTSPECRRRGREIVEEWARELRGRRSSEKTSRDAAAEEVLTG